MAHLSLKPAVQISMITKVAGVSLVLLLAACTTDQRYKRQVSGDESYLDAPAPRVLNVPEGMILPLQNAEFDIPPTTLQGNVGKQLDIRPPVQGLALLSGSRVQSGSMDSGTLLLENSPQNQNLWSQVVRVVQENNFTIMERQDASQTLTTDWIQWARSDEDIQYEGRYQISVQQKGYQLALVVKLLALQQQGSAVNAPTEMQRYTGIMLNTLSEGLDRFASDQEKRRTTGQAETFDVQSGSDDTGLPLLIVRGAYSQVWERLPDALPKLGMRVSDRSRSQGTLTLDYQALGSAGWEALGIEALPLQNDSYKLQVGDLDNRTSLQFTDAKGTPLTQVQNDALVAALQAAFRQAGKR